MYDYQQVSYLLKKPAAKIVIWVGKWRLACTGLPAHLLQLAVRSSTNHLDISAKSLRSFILHFCSYSGFGVRYTKGILVQFGFQHHHNSQVKKAGIKGLKFFLILKLPKGILGKRRLSVCHICLC